MKVLITGSRHFHDYERFKEALGGLPIDELIHGGARGADTLAQRFAEDRKIPCRCFPALWEQHGKRAGPIRNAQMLKEGSPDYCVAFLAERSRGTADMIRQAKKAGIEVEVINI